jgi:hypothetical protein
LHALQCLRGNTVEASHELLNKTKNTLGCRRHVQPVLSIFNIQHALQEPVQFVGHRKKTERSQTDVASEDTEYPEIPQDKAA